MDQYRAAQMPDVESIRYAVMNPTGNITILVETPVPEASQPFLASLLMEREPAAEQVGFLSDIRKWKSMQKHDADEANLALRMAGGEFCGNATMSAAVWYAMQNDLTEEVVTVRASGAPEPVPVQVETLPDGGYRGTVSMPRPVAVHAVQLPLETEWPCGSSGDNARLSAADSGNLISCPVVQFEGIDHVILEQEFSREQAELLAPVWCRQLSVEAVGLMFLDREAGGLKPLVYVPAAGTLVWENSCASGTTAVGVWLASQSGGLTGRAASQTITLQEPGGALSVSVTGDAILLTGTVTRLNGVCHKTLHS